MSILDLINNRVGITPNEPDDNNSPSFGGCRIVDPATIQQELSLPQKPISIASFPFGTGQTSELAPKPSPGSNQILEIAPKPAPGSNPVLEIAPKPAPGSNPILEIAPKTTPDSEASNEQTPKNLSGRGSVW